MIVLESISERLKECVRNSGMSQTELARNLGISQQTVSSYVHGKKMPALDTFANLCKVLDVDPSYILCLVD